MENQGKTLQLNYPKNSHLPLILPCRPSSPDWHVSLELQTNSYRNGKLSSDPLWISQDISTLGITFDPKVGFKLLKFHLSNNLYRCVALTTNYMDSMEDNITPQDYVYLNVSLVDKAMDSNSGIASGFKPKEIIRNEASAQFLNASTFSIFSKFKCCSGVPGKLPKLYTLNCYSPLRCNMLRNTLPWENTSKFEIYLLPGMPVNGSTDCLETLMYFSSVFILCKSIDEIDFAKFYNNQFDTRATGTVTNRSSRLNQVSNGNIVSLTKCKYFKLFPKF